MSLGFENVFFLLFFAIKTSNFFNFVLKPNNLLLLKITLQDNDLLLSQLNQPINLFMMYFQLSGVSMQSVI